MCKDFPTSDGQGLAHGGKKEVLANRMLDAGWHVYVPVQELLDSVDIGC